MHTSRHRDPAAAKRRDRARSLLPSAARTSARANLSAVRRRHRRAVRQALAAVTPPTGRCACENAAAEDTCALCDVAIPDYPLSDHLDAIATRREADKVGPVLRWSRTRRDVECAALGVDELDEAQAADLLRRLRVELPTGVVGWHAVSHLAWEIGPRPAWWYRRPARPDDRVAQLGSVARWALAYGRHKELNRQCRALTSVRAFDEATAAALGYAYTPCPAGWVQTDLARWRPLAGWHDVGAWASDVARALWRPDSIHPLLAWARQLGWRQPTDPA
jgi:hypothetical protein